MVRIFKFPPPFTTHSFKSLTPMFQASTLCVFFRFKFLQALVLQFDCKREKLQREVTRLLGDDGILLFPAFPTTAPFHNESLLTPLNLIYTAIWNVLGLPAVWIMLYFILSTNKIKYGHVRFDLSYISCPHVICLSGCR